jgi:hypothetical protein
MRHLLSGIPELGSATPTTPVAEFPACHDNSKGSKSHGDINALN